VEREVREAVTRHPTPYPEPTLVGTGSSSTEIESAPPPGPLPTHRPARQAAHRRSGLNWTLVLTTVVVLSAAIGIALRLWFLAHQPITSDAAIPGLMAERALDGHFVTFYWGQQYGGVEPYVVSALVGLFGATSWVLGGTAALLSLAGSCLVWRIALRIVSDPMLAALAGAIFWVGSEVVIWNSTFEYGFRGVTMLAGLACVLFALRILDRGRKVTDFVALGLSAGIGWWASPEIVYFAVPALGFLVWGVARGPSWRRAGYWIPRAFSLLAALGIGALPWIWTNADTGFLSLDRSKFPVPTGAPGYFGRLELFFRESLAMLLNVRFQTSGSYVGGVALLSLAYLALTATVVLCLLRSGRTRLLAVSVLVFPFLYAASPTTWYWEDGRYVVYLWPIVAACAAVPSAVGDLGRKSHLSVSRADRVALGRLLGTVALLVTIALSLTVFFRSSALGGPSSFASDWSDPDAVSTHIANQLVQLDLQHGFANYWMAYKLDYLSGGILQYTPTTGDTVRNLALADNVARSHPQTWLFISPEAGPEGPEQFVVQPGDGPVGLTESSFRTDLARLNVPYRIQRLGIVDAVTPARNVILVGNATIALAPS